MMKSFFSLLSARNKEFYRDKGSLTWAIIFPILAIVGCALAFSENNEKVLNIGTINYNGENISLLNESYLDVIHYQNKEKALQRVSQHQLHLLLDNNNKTYWINPYSSQGKIVEQLLNSKLNNFKRLDIPGKAIRYVDWVLPGILGMNIMFGALFGVGYVIVRYRKNGVLKRLKATPISALEFITAQISSRLIIILCANIFIFVAAIFLLDLLMLGSYFDLLFIAILGAFSLISLGLLMSSRTDSEELAGGLLNLATWPMMFLSGVWFSLDKAPSWLQDLALAFPLTHFVNASRKIMLHGTSLLQLKTEIIALLCMVIIYLGLAAVLFRWHKT